MSLLGFDALGRLALGQLPHSGNGQGTLTQAAGTGVAGSLTSKVDKGITQAAGTGVAGQITANPAGLIIGASGTGIAGLMRIVDSVSFFAPISTTNVGVAGSMRASVSGFFVGAIGTGIAGSVSGVDTTGLVGVAGIGVAHGITPSVLTFIAGVSGSGRAGSMSGVDTSGVQGVAGIGVVGSLIASVQAFFQQAAGTGVAGQIGAQPGGNFTGVAGTGVAGQITVTISGGGTSRKPGHGLEPVKKRPTPPAPTKPKVVLPPSLDISPPLAPAETSPIDHIEYAQRDLRGIEASIHEAMDATDIEHMLRHLDDENERQRQDEADIADITAMLELID